MANNEINQIYDALNDATKLTAEALDMSYTEALHETFQNLHLKGVQQFDGEPSDEVKAQLEEKYRILEGKSLGVKEIRLLIQLLMLEGDRVDQLPPNNQMTPPTISLLMGDIIAKVLEGTFEKTQPVKLTDLAIGTGNLWGVVSETLRAFGFNIEGSGVDSDELMLSIGEHALALEGHEPELYHSDALQNLYIPKSDVIVSDLPLGYYPNKAISDHYQSENSQSEGNDRGLSYIHPLFIEQGFQVMNDNGWGVYLVPGNVAEMPGFDKLLETIQSFGYLQGILQLPSNMFRQSSMKKAILVVQKKGERAVQAPHVLIGEIPDIKDVDAVRKYQTHLEEWADEVHDAQENKR